MSAHIPPNSELELFASWSSDSRLDVSSTSSTSTFWSSSIPSLTSTSSSLASVSLASHLSDAELLAEDGCVSDDLRPRSKRSARKFYLWTDFAASSNATSRSPFAHLFSTSRVRNKLRSAYRHARLPHLTTWERFILVLFSVYLVVFLRALTGRGATAHDVDLPLQYRPIQFQDEPPFADDEPFSKIVSVVHTELPAASQRDQSDPESPSQIKETSPTPPAGIRGFRNLENID